MEIARAIRRFISHKSRLGNEFRLVAGEIRIQTEKKKLEATRQTHSHFQNTDSFSVYFNGSQSKQYRP